MSFADKVHALQSFFGIATGDRTLVERVAAMNAAMGIADADRLPLPEQVEALLAATGVNVAAGAAASSGSEGAAAGGSGSGAGAWMGTTLDHIGTRPDTKLAKALARHAARQHKPLPDERQQKIAELRVMMEGGPNAPDKYKHADYLPADAEGALPTQIAGGRSYSESMVQFWESPSFFKDVATKLATKPAVRRCNPVGGKYPEFR